MTLVAVLTQKEPQVKSGKQGLVVVPETIPQPLREIARRCLQADPQQRCTLDEILSKTRPPASPGKDAARTKVAAAHTQRRRPKRWIIVPIVITALLLMALIGIKILGHQPAVPAAETRAANPPASAPATQSPAPFSGNKNPAQKGIVRSSVLQQVMPDVSRSAQNTITGRFRVSVQVEVDASGNVSEAKIVSPGPSKYFANHALAAARDWKFNPPQVDGRATRSEWILRFQFARANIQVFSAEIEP